MNTIILQHGYITLTNDEYKHFQKGDTIMGDNSNPEELERWTFNNKEDALKELSQYKCNYKRRNEHLIDIEEYALEYCITNVDGEFLEGSDFQFADE